jgi:HEPN domain-containing protein
MRPADEVKRDIVRQWLAKAEEDLGAAEILISHKTAYLSAVGFHRQQAAEKFFKALLTFNRGVPTNIPIGMDAIIMC